MTAVAPRAGFGERRASLPIATAFGVVCAAAVATATAAVSAASRTDLSPITPPGEWKGVWVGAAVAGFVAYVAGAWSARRSTSVVAVAAVAVAVQLAPLGAPLLLSRDVYAYVDYGRIAAVHGGNPYRDPPSRFRADPVYPQVGTNWVDRITAYGPVTTAASALIEAPNPSVRASTYAFRIFAALSMLATVAVAAAAAPAGRRAFAIAFVGWNPLLALHFAGGGHNDALAVAFGIAAVALSRRRHVRSAGAAAAGAVFAKAAAGVFLPVAVARRLRERMPLGLGGFAAATAVIALGATLVWGRFWISSTWQLHGQAETASSLSIGYWLHRAGVPQLSAVRGVLAVFAVAYGWLLWQAWRGRERLALTMVLLVATTAWVMPWYAVWAVPFAAIEEDAVAQVLAVVLSAWLLHDALPL